MLSIKNVNEELVNGVVSGNTVINTDRFGYKMAYDTVMANYKEIEGKKFVSIPLDLLEIDESYQRLFCINMSKIDDLVHNFNMNKCDPILVAPHPETSTFAVIDGTHRVLAFEIMNKGSICATIAEGLSDNPEERSKEEAEIFCGQGINVDRMAPTHKHRAYVKMGVKKYVILDECMKGRKLFLNIHEFKNLDKEKQDELISEGWRVLSGYTALLAAAAHSKGKEMVTTIFDIIEKSGWHSATNGYGTNVIRPVSAILNMHDFDPAVTQAIINVFSTMEPDLFMSKAHAAYPGRKEKERLTMWLEKAVAKKLGVEPIYTGGDMRKVASKYNGAKRNASASDKTTPFPTTGTEK